MGGYFLQPVFDWLLQVWNEVDAEEEVLAMVVRTGLRYPRQTLPPHCLDLF